MGNGIKHGIEHAIVYHPSGTSSVAVVRRTDLEMLWRTLAGDGAGQLGAFPGWLPDSLPVVVTSSGGFTMVGMGNLRN